MPELRFVTGGDHLKFRNRVLIKLRRGSAAQFVLIGQTIDEKTRIVGALAENRSCVVAIKVGLPIDCDAGNKLEQVQIIPAVDRHVADFARHDRGADGRTLRFQQWWFGRDLNLLVTASDIQANVVTQGAIQRDFQTAGYFGAKTVSGHRDAVGSGRQGRQAVLAGRIGGHRPVDCERRTLSADLRTRQRKTLFVGHSALNGRSRLRDHDAWNSEQAERDNQKK